MISPSTGLENDCHVTAVTIVCYGHHGQCGLDFHPLHTPVFLCLHTLPPFSASIAPSAAGALLGEHPPREPRQEGRPSGRHMGQVGHEVYMKETDESYIFLSCISPYQALRQASLHEHGGGRDDWKHCPSQYHQRTRLSLEQD